MALSVRLSGGVYQRFDVALLSGVLGGGGEQYACETRIKNPALLVLPFKIFQKLRTYSG